MKTLCTLLLGTTLLMASAGVASAQTAGRVDTIGGAFEGFSDGDNTISQFRNPAGLTLDGSGNLYIADQDNNRVRVMQLSSTLVRTVAEVSQPSAVVYDTARNLLYVASVGAGNVSRFDAFGNSRGIVITDLNQPTALTLDTNGNIFVSEMSGLTRRYTTNGVVSGIYRVTVGTPNVRGVAVTSGGRVVVSDAGNHVIWQFSGSATAPVVIAGAMGSPGFVEGPAEIARINGPHHLAVGPNDSLVFADRYNHRVRMLTCDRNVQTLFGVDPSQWETFPDPSIFPGWADGSVDIAEAREPVGLAVNAEGVVFDTEAYYDIIRAASGLIYPRCGGGNTFTNTFVPTPVLSPNQGFFPDGLWLTVVASNLTQSFGPDINLYYTIDGSNPTQASPQIPIGIDGQGEVFIPGRVDMSLVRVIAISNNGSSSPVVAGRAAEGRNMITLGFEEGEASSDFVASPGQKFIAPVTLTTIPGTSMYGLQFSLKIDPVGAAPVADFELGFDSMLMRPDPSLPGVYTVIPNEAFKGYAPPELILRTFTNVFGLLQVITITNFPPTFDSMLFTNTVERLLGVGWVERAGKTNLYDTLMHDLIRFSIPHDSLYVSDQGKVVPGGFMFRVPPAARPNHSYVVQIGRPSATGDGVRSDVIIEAPGTEDPSPAKAIRKLTIGTKRYIVGDVAPFTWFNAGDFGDTNILNNDITQFQSGIVYFLGNLIEDSDFRDAFDTCCVATNATGGRGFNYGVDFNPLASTASVINTLGYGDGLLTVADMFVAYRRALDPTLTWYARFWTNVAPGVAERRAVPVPNTFRGGSGFQTLSTAPSFASDADLRNSDPMQVSFVVPDAQVMPGQVLDLPIKARVSGGVPFRSLLFQVKVQSLDGGVPIKRPVQFMPSVNLGPSTYSVIDSPAFYSGAWLDLTRTAINGETVLGTLRITIPANANPYSAYEVKLENVSASPNGIYLFPVEVSSGLVFMKDRPQNWGDEIPNAWREQYFTTLMSYDARLDGDPDGDGVSNLGEYKAGTNPVDGQDTLVLRANRDSLGRVKFAWQSVAGKRYILEWTSSPTSGRWFILGSTRDGTGSELQASDDPLYNARFYRLRVE